MACQIINPKHASLNGSPGAYNGVITSVSLNIGGLASGGIRATVSLVKDPDLPPEFKLLRPNQGDYFVLNAAGMHMKLDVGSYNFSNQAGSTNTLTLNMVDQSHKYLDHDFIALKEECPATMPNVSLLGEKYGTLPDSLVAETIGISNPAADTKFGKLRSFFNHLAANGPQNFFSQPNSILDGAILDREEVDRRVRKSSGKSQYYIYVDPYNEDGASVLVDNPDSGGYTTRSKLSNKDGTLALTLGGLITGSLLPNGPWAVTGSYRSVINEIVSESNMFAIWDANENKVVIKHNLDLEEGKAKFKRIVETCQVLGVTDGADFTNTERQGAIGSMSTASSGMQGQGRDGGKQVRYFKVSKLSSNFHIKPCGGGKATPVTEAADDGRKTITRNDVEQKVGRVKNPTKSAAVDKKKADDLEALQKSMKKIRFNDDVLKAMSAASDPKIFAMYVVQSVFKKIKSAKDAAAIKFIQKPAGRGNEKPEEEFKPYTTLDDRVKKYSGNDFLADYYMGEKATDCTAKITPFVPLKQAAKGAVRAGRSTRNATVEGGGADGDEGSGEDEDGGGGELLSEIETKFGKINEDAGKDAGGGGGGGGGGGAGGGGNVFPEGIFFHHKVPGFCTILDHQVKLLGEKDILRGYLNAIAAFHDRWFVIREGLGLRSVSTPYKDYGYYVTSQSGDSGMNIQTDGAFEKTTINPFAKLSEANPDFKDLAKFSAMMYLPDGECVDSFLEKKSVVSFIRALDTGALKSYFSNTHANKSAKEEEDADEATKGSQSFVMHLIRVRQGQNSAQIAELTSSTSTCSEQGGEKNTTQASGAEAITNGIEQYDIKNTQGHAPSLKSTAEVDKEGNAKGFAIGLITTADVGALISPLELASESSPDANGRAKAWFETEGGGPGGHFFMYAGHMPYLNKNVIWKSKLKSGINISSTDLGLNNESFQELQASAANQNDAVSQRNQGLMQSAMEKKVFDTSYLESLTSWNQGLTVLLTDDDNIEIPSLEEGLQSLSISNSKGRTTAQLTIGNKALLEMRSKYREMSTEHPLMNHTYYKNIPDTFSNLQNQKFIQIGKGESK